MNTQMKCYQVPLKNGGTYTGFIVSMDGKQTEVIDEVEFELPFSILGKLFEGYAYKQLQNTFEYRKSLRSKR
jgi:ligand-binding SRPBCC domain-containing protein